MLIFRGTILTILFILLATLPSQFTNAAVFDADPTSPDVTNSALIIVAGRKLEADRLQANIHNVTAEFYESAKNNGYNDDDIYYLATDSSLVGYDAAANLANLESAIVDWSSERLQSGGSLSIYMFDHGDPDEFYVDGLSNQILTPTSLDNWLGTLEGRVMGVEINVIIEAGESGSFISANNGRIGRSGRVIITSTSDDGPSYNSADGGAIFSDQIITFLNQGSDLRTSFLRAQEAAQGLSGVDIQQNPWIDADGDGIHNEAEDLNIASERKFFNDQGALAPTDTPTWTSTPTWTPTITPTSTPTRTPIPDGNACDRAIQVPTNGLPRQDSFESTTDLEWFSFEGMQNKTYRISINVPHQSSADVTLELYPDCDNNNSDHVHESFSAGVQQEFTPPRDGPVYLRLSSEATNPSASDMSYHISAQEVQAVDPMGAVIIVAGRLKENDRLQPNIQAMTDKVFDMYIDRGYIEEDIRYLSTVDSFDSEEYKLPATVDDLRRTITDWAVNRIKLDYVADVLTLYMMDHGKEDALFLDGTRNEILNPYQLDEWLTVLEEAVPGIKINVIIEACHAGSFIKAPGSISKEGRIIVTSSDQEGLAYASKHGAYFSEHFLTAIIRGENLFSSWWQAKNTTQGHSRLKQKPWIDGNGNGIHNEQEDYNKAAVRGFGYVGTLSNEETEQIYLSHITQAEISQSESGSSGIITVRVQTDGEVEETDHSGREVWAVVYSPSYTPPESSSVELVGLDEETTSIIELTSTNNEYYEGKFDFTEVGNHRVVIHAVDENDLSAPSQEVEFMLDELRRTDEPNKVEVPAVQQKIYLPFISQ